MGDWSMAVFYIASLDVYGSLYGEESKVRILQHVASILGQMLHVPDWVFHIEDNMFVVLSTPDRLERIMPIIMKRLESSMSHFISDADQERGFFMLKQDTLYSRIPMLRVGAGVLSTVTTPFNNLKAVVSKGLYMTHKAMTQLPAGEPAWLSDKLTLGGGVEETDSTTETVSTPYIIVVEPDAALAFLLQQTIGMNGMDVEVMPSISEAKQAIKKRSPFAVIVDPFLSAGTIQENMSVWEPLTALKAAAPHAFVLATCNHDNDEEALIHGADAYLPKPYQIFPLLSWLDGVVKSRL
jgi:CheY-like chemotaxis protein/GGDEF domain-containing protein